MGQALGGPMKGMHKKSIAQQLLEVKPETSERTIALLIAEQCIELSDKPYRFAINHDIRPPKLAPCPLSHYDWAKRDKVGIDTSDTAIARRWLTSAAMKGYTISRVDTTYNDMPFSTSLEIVRRHAKWHQRPQSEKDHDDDIPF